MKVYIVMCTHPCYEKIRGVYSSRESAVEARSDDPHMRIHEWEVDGE